jgi:serine/threonine-protein kinase
MIDLPERFRIERTIDDDLCEAIVVADGTRVAIKMLAGLDAKQRARLREVGPRLLTSHPHILPVLECGPDFVVMAFVDQPRTLADALGQPFEPARACRIALQILAALEASPLVHGDLRPPNVLLDEHDLVRVTGFGLQYVLTELRETRAGPVPPAEVVMYAPPERLHGQVDLERSADVYGVGAMLYQMLAGSPPFDPDQLVFRLAVDVQTMMPPALADARLDAIVQGAMRKDPWLRFPSATELAEAITAVSHTSTR